MFRAHLTHQNLSGLRGTQRTSRSAVLRRRWRSWLIDRLGCQKTNTAGPCGGRGRPIYQGIATLLSWYPWCVKRIVSPEKSVQP
jgi:hypothetical protein